MGRAVKGRGEDDAYWDARALFLTWKTTHEDHKLFRNRKTGDVIERFERGFDWDSDDATGRVTGVIVVCGQGGRRVGHGLGCNYLDVDPVTPMEVLAWAANP